MQPAALQRGRFLPVRGPRAGAPGLKPVGDRYVFLDTLVYAERIAVCAETLLAEAEARGAAAAGAAAAAAAGAAAGEAGAGVARAGAVVMAAAGAGAYVHVVGLGLGVWWGCTS
jgi:hypothetical protein